MTTTATITSEDIRQAIQDSLGNMLGDFDTETKREYVIDRMDEECDAVFGQLVMQGPIDKYTVDDLVNTCSNCAAIIRFAEEVAWVEDDYGLWGGLKYGILASIAFFSLQNCFYQLLKNMGHDTNDEFPFAEEESEDD